jgi:hypothetical protein
MCEEIGSVPKNKNHRYTKKCEHPNNRAYLYSEERIFISCETVISACSVGAFGMSLWSKSQLMTSYVICTCMQL